MQFTQCTLWFQIEKRNTTSFIYIPFKHAAVSAWCDRIYVSCKLITRTIYDQLQSCKFSIIAIIVEVQPSKL